MKKLILSVITCTAAASVFAQGTVTFNMRVAGIGTTHVFGPDGLLIGTAGGMTGSTTFATLIGAPGSNAPDSIMLPSITLPTTFRTGAAAGIVVATTDTFSNILADSAVATFEMVAWDNSSGLYPTWTLASDAVKNGLIIGGASAPFVIENIGGVVNVPPGIVSSIPGQGLQSFTLMPEPTSVTLVGLGAAALWMFHRRK
jgi:hypothetical protein